VNPNHYKILGTHSMRKDEASAQPNAVTDTSYERTATEKQTERHATQICIVQYIRTVENK